MTSDDLGRLAALVAAQMGYPDESQILPGTANLKWERALVEGEPVNGWQTWDKMDPDRHTVTLTFQVARPKGGEAFIAGGVA
jgi:hypothetical protein